MPTFTTFVQHGIGSPHIKVRLKKELKGTQIGNEEVKPSLFVDGMILYIENTEDLTTTRSHQEFCKFVGYKISILKSVAFICTSNELSERKFNETIPFRSASKRVHT